MAKDAIELFALGMEQYLSNFIQDKNNSALQATHHAAEKFEKGQTSDGDCSLQAAKDLRSEAKRIPTVIEQVRQFRSKLSNQLQSLGIELSPPSIFENPLPQPDSQVNSGEDNPLKLDEEEFNNLCRDTMRGLGHPRLFQLTEDQKQLRIDELDLTNRTHNTLKRRKYETLGQIIVKSEQELLELHNFGVVCLNDLVTKLVAKGIIPLESYSRSVKEQELSADDYAPTSET